MHVPVHPCVCPRSIFVVFKANPNHVLRDEAARAAEEGRDYVSAQGIDQALQVQALCLTHAHSQGIVTLGAGSVFRIERRCQASQDQGDLDCFVLLPQRPFFNPGCAFAGLVHSFLRC
jgi:hypothetical protein